MIYRLLVCGGRDYRDRDTLEWALRKYARRYADLAIITGYDPDDGRYQGADQIAFEWASVAEVPVFPFPAPWRQHKKAAGPIRNLRMLKLGRPHGVLAAPGGPGTANMCLLAEKAGLVPHRLDTEA